MCYVGSISDISRNLRSRQVDLGQVYTSLQQEKRRMGGELTMNFSLGRSRTDQPIDLGQTNQSIYDDRSILVPKHLDDEKRKKKIQTEKDRIYSIRSTSPKIGRSHPIIGRSSPVHILNSFQTSFFLFFFPSSRFILKTPFKQIIITNLF